MDLWKLISAAPPVSKIIFYESTVACPFSLSCMHLYNLSVNNEDIVETIYGSHFEVYNKDINFNINIDYY